MNRAAFLFTICAATAVAACTRVPELEDKLTMDLRHAEYPQLQPLDDLIQPRLSPEEESEALQRNLDARSARLRNRANALRNAPIN